MHAQLSVLHADWSTLHMQLAGLWLDGHFVGATSIPFLKTSGLFADLNFMLFPSVLKTLLHFHPSLKDWLECGPWPTKRSFWFLCFLAVWKNCLVTSGRCNMRKKRRTKHQHFSNFTWATDNVALFPHELKVMIGQGCPLYFWCRFIWGCSSGNSQEDMGQGGKWGKRHNRCISVISKDSQCGCIQNFHPPLSKNMWKRNCIKQQTAFLFTENTDQNKQPSSASYVL